MRKQYNGLRTSRASRRPSLRVRGPVGLLLCGGQDRARRHHALRIRGAPACDRGGRRRRDGAGAAPLVAADRAALAASPGRRRAGARAGARDRAQGAGERGRHADRAGSCVPPDPDRGARRVPAGRDLPLVAVGRLRARPRRRRARRSARRRIQRAGAARPEPVRPFRRDALSQALRRRRAAVRGDRRTADRRRAAGDRTHGIVRDAARAAHARPASAR